MNIRYPICRPFTQEVAKTIGNLSMLGWLDVCSSQELPVDEEALGQTHDYKRHGTTTLFAAFEVVTGLVKAGHYKRRHRREFLDFMSDLVADYPKDVALHVVLHNLNTHEPKHDRWLQRHPHVHFHFTHPRQICQAIDDFIEVYNLKAAPFEWRKESVHQVSLKQHYADLCQ